MKTDDPLLDEFDRHMHETRHLTAFKREEEWHRKRWEWEHRLGWRGIPPPETQQTAD